MSLAVLAPNPSVTEQQSFQMELISPRVLSGHIRLELLDEADPGLVVLIQSLKAAALPGLHRRAGHPDIRVSVDQRRFSLLRVGHDLKRHDLCLPDQSTRSASGQAQEDQSVATHA